MMLSQPVRKAQTTTIYSTLAAVHATITPRRFFASTSQLRDPAAEVKITDRLSMKGKTVLVTGGGRGIGFSICKAVAQLGGNVAVLDAIAGPVDEFETLNTKYGAKTHYERVDVTVQSSLEAGFESIIKQSGGIHGCVTAAGITLERPFLDHTWDECQRMLMVNTLGTFWAARLAADHMISCERGGSIVMIASLAAQGVMVPSQSLSMYSMTKASVKGLVGPLAVELGHTGIRVNSISPGVIDSQMTRDNATKFPKLTDMYHNAPPVKRIGQPSDLTPIATYLLSDASTFTTGSDFPITGGIHAGVSPSWLERC